MTLSEEQIERYSRHIILQDVGGEGQGKILNFQHGELQIKN